MEKEWNKKNAERFKNEAERKKEVALGQERKRLGLMEELKVMGGPLLMLRK